MEKKKFFSAFVLVLFVISVLPLAMARNGEGMNGGIQAGATTANLGTGYERDGADYQTDDDSPTGTNSQTNNGSWNEESKPRVLGYKYANASECANAYMQKFPEAEPAKVQAACEYAFQAREMLAPRIAESLPRVQRFMVQDQEKIMAFLEKLDEHSAKMIRNLDRARLRECLNNTDDCRELMKQWRLNQEKVKNMIREREINKNKLTESNKNFLKAKNKYDEAKKNHEKARNEFAELKKQLAQCEKEKGNCTEIEEQLLDKAKENLLALTDRLIQHLEKVKSKIESSENIDEEDANIMIDNINDYIDQLDEVKNKISEADTKEELRQAAQEIKQVWKDLDYYAKRYAERIVHAYTRGVFVRSELLEKKLEEVLKRLEEKGVDTSSMEDLLDEFSNYLDEARDKMKESSDLFNEAKSLRNVGDLEAAKEKLEEAKVLTREAHEALKEAHKTLMEMVRQINKSGESFNPDAVNEEEEVEIVNGSTGNVDED